MSINDSEREKFLNKIKEIREENDRKIERYRLILAIFEAILVLTGYSILIYHNKWIALGLFLLNFGSNLALMRVIFSEKENAIKNIWKYRK
jgi:fatty acid desaturase